MSYIDTRDLYTELVELRDRANNVDDAQENPHSYTPEEIDALEPLDEDETEHLKALEELADEIGEDTLRNGEIMVPVNEFAEYAEELAHDLGIVNRDQPWPLSHIDWEAAAQELSEDYTEVEFDGMDYYVRVS